MAKILHTQLFDFPAYEAAIKEVKAATVDFGKSVSTVMERLKKDQASLNTTLREYSTILKALNVSQVNVAANLGRYNQEIDQTIVKQTQLKGVFTSLDVVLTANKHTLQNIVREYKDLKSAHNSVKVDQTEVATKVKAATEAIKAQGQALNNTKKTIDAAEGSYRAMQTQLGNLRTQLRNLPGAFDPITGKINKNSVEAKKLLADIGALDKVLKQADKSMGLYFRNIGNYQSVLGGLGKGIKGIVGNIGLLIGINSAFEAFNFVVDQNKKFEALNMSIKLVSGTTEQYAKNNAFLNKTADNLGLEIIGLSNSYKGFYAAATAANIPAGQTNQIFGQISKAAANLKLSQDDVNGVFTAFGQIASKGTVQSEELRGQIGERIPGAFALAAKSMNVTTAELNKLLKDGKVASNEFLPKFAAELEKTFGKAERIDSLQAATNRFSNALKRLVTDDSGALSQFFAAFLDGATAFLKVLDGAGESTADLIEEFERARTSADNYSGALLPLIKTYDELINKQGLTESEQETLNLTIEEIASIVPGAVTALGEYGNALDINRAKVFQFIEAQNKIATAARNTALKSAVDEAKESLKEYKKIIADFQRGKTTDVNKGGMGGVTETALFDGTLLTDRGKRLNKQKEETAIELKRIAEQIIALGQELPADLAAFLKTVDGVKFQKLQALTKLGSELKILQEKAVAKTLEIQANTNSANSAALQKQLEEILVQKAELQKKIDQLNNPTLSSTGPTFSTAKKAGGKSQEQLLKESIKNQQRILQDAAELDIKRDELRLAKKEINEAEFEARKLKLTSDFAYAAIDLENKLGKNADQGRIDDFKKRLVTQQAEYEKYLSKQAEKDRQRSGYGVKLAETPEAAGPDINKLIASQEKRAQAAVDAENKAFALIQAGRDTSYKEEIAHLERLKAIRVKFAQSTAEEEYAIKQLAAERQRQLDEQTNQFIFDAINTGLQIVQDAFNAKYEARIAKLQEEKEKELTAAGTNAVAKEKIEKEYAKKIAAEKQKQARADKALALFGVAINTAQGVAKSIAIWGMPLAIPFIALAIGAGVLQAAAIAAKPIPQFKKGTKHAPKGPAITGEEGFEFIERNGKLIPTQHGPGISWLESGDKVHTHRESKKMVEDMLRAQESKQISETAMLHGALAAQIRKSRDERDIAVFAKALSKTLTPSDVQEAMEKAFDNKLRIERHTYDERGYRKSLEEKNSRDTYLNDRYSFGR